MIFKHSLRLACIILLIYGCDNTKITQTEKFNYNYHDTGVITIDLYTFSWYDDEIIYTYRVCNIKPIETDSIKNIEREIAKRALKDWEKYKITE